MRDFYRILGVPDNATMADIKSAYRRLAKLYHPDLNPGSRHSEEKFKEILDAYTILSDEELRAQYDRKRRMGYNAEPFHSGTAEKKRDPGRKEYPPEYIEMMRQRNRSRVVKQINRRKKILRGMVITFTLYLIGTAVFEAWISKQREEEAAAIVQRLNEKRRTDSVHNANDVIQNLDSPYDSIFGPGRTTWLSPNQLVVINPFSDAVICLMRADTPYVTIRNEFIHARQTFVMRELPNGTYQVKVYTGEEWSDYLSVPDGRRLGGFSRNEKFFLLNHDAITLLKPTYNQQHTITSDTVRIDTSMAEIRLISKEEFFRSPGNTTR